MTKNGLMKFLIVKWDEKLESHRKYDISKYTVAYAYFKLYIMTNQTA